MSTHLSAGDLHPAVRLRHHHVQIYLNWDGSYTLCPDAEIISRDGAPTGQRHGHAYRIGPRDPLWRALSDALAPALRAHYSALGLEEPEAEEGDLPYHLHPQGYPAQEQARVVPAPHGSAPTRADHYHRLVAHLVSATQDEINGQRAEGVPLLMLDPLTHPAVQPLPEPAPPAAPEAARLALTHTYIPQTHTLVVEVHSGGASTRIEKRGEELTRLHETVAAARRSVGVLSETTYEHVAQALAYAQKGV